VAGLGSMCGRLYHLGIRGQMVRSTLADANKSHDRRIFADFAENANQLILFDF
jgi:hypothetical protein